MIKLCTWPRTGCFLNIPPNGLAPSYVFGLDAISNRTVLHVRPNIYIKLFDNLLNIGAQFLYAQDYGEGKVYKGSAYYYMEIEPKIQFNFAPNAYLAFVYNWRREYSNDETLMVDSGGKALLQQKQWFNLRVGLYF